MGCTKSRIINDHEKPIRIEVTMFGNVGIFLVSLWNSFWALSQPNQVKWSCRRNVYPRIFASYIPCSHLNPNNEIVFNHFPVRIQFSEPIERETWDWKTCCITYVGLIDLNSLFGRPGFQDAIYKYESYLLKPIDRHSS